MRTLSSASAPSLLPQVVYDPSVWAQLEVNNVSKLTSLKVNNPHSLMMP